jgi:FkbM family methyltransferase
MNNYRKKFEAKLICNSLRVDADSMIKQYVSKLKHNVEDFVWQKSSRRRLLLIFSMISRRGFPIPSVIYLNLRNSGDDKESEDFGTELFMAKYIIPPKGLCLVDIGASVGLWTLYAGKRAVQVHAFEPSPIAYKFLTKRASSYPNVHTYPFALGEVNAVKKMSLSDFEIGAIMSDSYGRRIGEKIVDQIVYTLDSFRLEKIGVIKIDTEGYEIPILKGAQKTVERNRPLLIIEVHRKIGKASETFEAELERVLLELEDLGYSYTIHYRPTSLREMQPHVIAKPNRHA